MAEATIAGHELRAPRSIEVGASAERRYTITREQLLDFARITSDANPLHTDDTFGAATPFGAINVQGQLMSSLIVGVIGSLLPGAGWFCLGVNADFLQPCFAGATVVAGVRARQKIESLGVVVWEGWLAHTDGGQVLVRATIKTKYMF